MPRHLPILVLALLLADLASLIWLGGFVGVLPVLGLVILDIFLGSALIRRSGASISTVLNSAAGDKKAVSGGAAQGLLGAIAGLLFIIPGIASDFIALALLLPLTRRRLARFFESHVSTNYSVHPGRGVVIEAEAVEIVETRELESRPSREN